MKGRILSMLVLGRGKKWRLHFRDDIPEGSCNVFAVANIHYISSTFYTNIFLLENCVESSGMIYEYCGMFVHNVLKYV